MQQFLHCPQIMMKTLFGLVQMMDYTHYKKSWKNLDYITPPDMPKDTESIIEESIHNPGTIYVAGKRYQMDDRKPYLWKTNNYGKSWKKIIRA